MVILTIFEAILGLHVNLNKCFLYLVNQVDDLHILERNLGCQTGSIPTKYLGMPSGANYKSIGIWNEVLERCDRSWQDGRVRYSSLGGILTLINSVMDALPTYMVFMFPIPKGIEKNINKLRRIFLWQGNKDRKGYNLVKW